MARLSLLLFLVASVAAPASVASAHGSPPRLHPRPAVAGPASVRFAPPVAHHHAHVPVRPPLVFRPAMTTYVPMPRPVRLVPVRVRVIPVPVPYYVVSPSYPPAPVAYSSTASAQNWNWTRVDSVAPLAGQQAVRYFCPDSREYYPQVETCPSDWLKVLP